MRGIKVEDFQSGTMRSSLCAVAMSEDSKSEASISAEHLCHGGLALAIGGHGGIRRDGRARDGKDTPSRCWVEMHHGESVEPDWTSPRRKKANGHGASLARHWIALWIAASCCIPASGSTFACLSRAFEQTGRAREVEDEWSSVASEEVSNVSKGACMCMHASKDQLGLGGKPAPERSLVSGMPLKMEGGNHSHSTAISVSPCQNP